MAATIIVLRILSWWWVYILYGNCTHSGYQVNAYTPTSTSAKSTSSIATNATVMQQNSTYKIPIQVYILAGQSNMVGLGSISHLDVLIRYNGSSSTSSNMSQGTYQNEYRDTLWNGTNYKERDDVYIVYQTNSGKLTVSRTAGYAGGSDHFGPEVLFGWTVAEQQQQQGNRTMILLIKVAYGNRDLAIDFRPPSAGIEDYTNEIDDPDHYGWEYRVMINDTKYALNTIDRCIPNFLNQKVSFGSKDGVTCCHGRK